ncbi:MAG TPA: tripartite tricarboxylate transporter substrate binding protein [Burkholderiales bacterium]|nr:tripartite tricarboxylate transporter substrate binding protein [Burkholderiales bacterium]
MIRPFEFVAAFALGFCVAAAAHGETYPVKPVRLIVPFPPGSGVDIVSRIVSPRLGESLGQQIVVDNRAGAGGIVGAEIAAKAAPDGYNLFMATAGILTVVPFLSKVSYSVTRDFAPVTLVASVPSMLVVHPAMPVKTLKDLIALAKKKPGTINYASTGSGTLPHLAAELLKREAKIDIVHVPYKGSGPAMTDLLGGHVEMFFGNMLSVVPLVKSGKLRGLAVTSLKRSPVAPQMPTVAESGFPGFEAGTWFGLLVPTGTPQEIVARLHGDMVKVVHLPDVEQRLAEQGGTAIGNTPDAFGRYIATETEKWRRVLPSSGVRTE